MVNVIATSVELTGLRPESTYTISVRAYTAAGLREERRLTVAAATTNTCQLHAHAHNNKRQKQKTNKQTNKQKKTM